MQSEYELSKIEQEKRRLYRPTDENVHARPPELTIHHTELSSDWDTPLAIPQKPGIKKKRQIGNIIIGFGVFMFTAAAGFVLWQYTDPTSRPTDQNVILSINSPVEIASGLKSDFIFSVENRNRIGLDYATIAVTYPDGTRSVAPEANDFREEKKALGVIPSNTFAAHRSSAIFMGEENSTAEVKVVLEYRFQGMNAVFTKEFIKKITLTSSPVTATVRTLSEVNSGQEFAVDVIVSSNTTIPLRGLEVVLDSPPDFHFVGSDPKPTYGNNVWRIGDLAPGSKVTLHLRGYVSGVENQDQTFHTHIGVASPEREQSLALVYRSVQNAIRIKKPFIGVDLKFEGDVAENVINPLKSAPVVINWKNNLADRVTEARISVRIKGDYYDKNKMEISENGEYNANMGTIVWDARGTPALRSIDPQGSGVVTFRLMPLRMETMAKLPREPKMNVEVTIQGKRLGENGVPELIDTVVSRDLLVQTNAQLIAQTLHKTGALSNYGPIPPKVDEETSYTVNWSVVNTTNDLKNVVVRTVLPFYVSWRGTLKPADANVTYNDVTGEVVWTVGDVPAGTGYSKPKKELAYQIILTPRTTQVGKVIDIVGESLLTAVDSFTGQKVEVKKDLMNTQLSAEPVAGMHDGRVVP